MKREPSGRRRRGLLVLLLLLGLIIGVLLAGNYGQSWDDPTNSDYGQDVLRAYGGSDAFWNHRNLPYYGPAHFAGSALLVGTAEALGLDWHPVDLRHLANYLAFLAGLAGFYLLAQAFFSPPIAILGTLLLATQPVVFGHAFINQKDMPFASFFVLAVSLGVVAARRFEDAANPDEKPDYLDFLERFDVGWRSSARPARIALVSAGAVALLLTVDLIGTFIALPFLESAVRRAYQGAALLPIQRAFDFIATDAFKTPLALYLQKLRQVYDWAGLLAAVGAWSSVGWMSARWMLQGDPRARARSQGGWPLLILAGMALGLATSMRVVGPLAGLLVVGYVIRQTGLKHIGKLAVYGLVAAATSYLTWPTLWGRPVRALIESFSLMTAYERHEVLYRGARHLSTELPWHYLPWLLTIKLSLIAVILILAGVLISSGGALKDAEGQRWSSFLPWVGLWVGLPAASVVLGQAPVYSNIRHLMFIVPPLFLFGCASLKWSIGLLKKWSIPAYSLAIVLVPGLVGIVTLHPYEYAYYNVLVGGVRGAQGQYELDYWCTSYREAMGIVNDVAHSGATVVAWGPERVARSFARTDLTVVSTAEDDGSPDVVLTCDDGLLAEWFYGDLPVRHEVSRAGVTLAEIKHEFDE